MFARTNTRCSVFDEDNRKEQDADGRHPVESHVFFDKLYPYPNYAEDRPQLSTEENKLFYVRVGNRWVSMVYEHGRYEWREYESLKDPVKMDELHENRVMWDWEHVEAVGLVTRYRGEHKRDPDTKKEYISVSLHEHHTS